MSKAIRLVLGFSAGSASDQIARALAPELSRQLERPVCIELRPGNNGADAACEVATAAADGCTLFMATLGSHALAPRLDANLPYDPLQHFEAVSLLSTAPLLLACHASLGVSSTRELIDLARNEPHALTYGTSAIGGAPHLAAELFQSSAGIDMRHVRYDHTERLYDDLEAGRISVSFNNIMSMLPRCRNGTLRALAVTSAQRSDACEDLPTIAESGLQNYEVSNWLGLVAPRGTADSCIEALSQAAAAALKKLDLVHAFHTAGVTPRGSTPAEFATFMAAEIRRWSAVVGRFRNLHA